MSADLGWFNAKDKTVLRSIPKRGDYVFCDRQGNPFKNFRRSFDRIFQKRGGEKAGRKDGHLVKISHGRSL